MALLTAGQAASSLTRAKQSDPKLITRGNNARQKRTLRQLKHICRDQAGQQSQKGCCALKSSLSHKGWVCGASLLLLTVTIRGLAKIHSIHDAGTALWALMGAFLLAGGNLRDELTDWFCTSTARDSFSCRPGISSVSLPCRQLWRQEQSCGWKAHRASSGPSCATRSDDTGATMQKAAPGEA